MTVTPRRPLSAHTPWDATGQPDEPGMAAAPRHEVVYECERGHVFGITLAVGATAPAGWDCRCGQPARLDGAPEGTGSGPLFPGYRHPGDHAPPPGGIDPWSQLLKRRTPDELEAALAERLAALRGGQP